VDVRKTEMPRARPFSGDIGIAGSKIEGEGERSIFEFVLPPMADHVVRRMTLPAHLFAVNVHQIARHSFGPAVPKKIGT